MNNVVEWVEMTLFKESVWVDGAERRRSVGETELDPQVGGVRTGTFDAVLEFPPGKKRIEIEAVSKEKLGSGIISECRVKAQ